MTATRASTRTARTSNLLPLSGFRDPLSLPNLLSWHDFSDAARMFTSNAGTGAVSSGSTVGYVTDKSGNGWHLTQGTANNRPTFTGSIGGVACLQFDGSNDALLSSSSWPLTGDATWTMFAVYNRSSATLGSVLSWGGSVNAAFFYRTAETCRATFGLGSQQQVMPLTLESTGTSYVLSLAKIPGPAVWSRPHRNGVRCELQPAGGLSLGIPNITSGALAVGQFPFSGSAFFSGQIGEVIFYSRELSAAERVSVTAWLGGKWGITIS